MGLAVDVFLPLCFRYAVTDEVVRHPNLTWHRTNINHAALEQIFSAYLGHHDPPVRGVLRINAANLLLLLRRVRVPPCEHVGAVGEICTKSVSLTIGIEQEASARCPVVSHIETRPCQRRLNQPR